MASVEVASRAYVDAIAAAQVGGMIGYDTLAALNADLGHDEGTIGYVTNDPTPANNGTYRKEGASGAGSWVQSSFDRVALVEADVAGLAGGATVTDVRLREMATAAAYMVKTATYDTDGVIQTASVEWPDGSAGTFTTTSKNTTWLAIDAYTVTHDSSGKTITQAAVTRNATGQVTVQPEITIT